MTTPPLVYSSIITLPAVLVARTSVRFVIAASGDVGTANVNTRGTGVGRRVERVAEAVGEIGAAVGRSVVAVAVGMPVAVQQLTRAGVIRLRPARRHHALLRMTRRHACRLRSFRKRI